jgi:hypothetical protein
LVLSSHAEEVRVASSQLDGVYQHCGEQHLHRYLAEFEFRYNFRIANGVDDRQRSREALAGITGKRLTYAS